MARARSGDQDYRGPVRRILVAILCLVLAAVFLVWRIDSPRVERLRVVLLDRIVPPMGWAMAPITTLADMVASFQSYDRIYQQNQDLRRELQQLKSWKEAALQLEQQNAKLLAQNQVRLDPKLTSVSGVVLADTGSPFSKSVLLNIGSRDGILDGWATMDGLGLVGRIAGVGQNVSRVLLLTDASSRVPVTIQPSGQRAMVVGDNSAAPPLDFIGAPEQVHPNDSVVSSGDGGVFPGGILVGKVIQTRDKRFRVLLSADYSRLEFVRVLRSRPEEAVPGAGPLIVPEPEPYGPALPQPAAPPPTITPPPLPDPTMSPAPEPASPDGTPDVTPDPEPVQPTPGAVPNG